ncbi:hypothetical protein G7Y79_00027g061170 [Physcia stellaris]|nr:hypothetical protein G7Y79_00027g061170 [Physcia stellaris]
MRRSLAATLTILALVKAQSVADLPACSLQCFATAVAATTCGPTDYVCQCTPSNKQVITDSWFHDTIPKFNSCHRRNNPLIVRCPRVTNIINSQSSRLGANFPGTNWQSTTNHSKANRGPAVEGVSITLFIIACLVVGFRLYARLRTQRLRQVAQGLGWDELFACVALAFTGGVLGTVIVGVRNGMGKHQDYQSAAELTTLVKSVYVFTILIAACFCALKLSILCLYLRMTPERSHHITIYVIMCIVAAHSIATIFGNIFQCDPISDYWNIAKIFNNTMGCVNLILMDIFNSAWSVFENIIIWLMPIPVVWALKVPRERKVGLYTLIGVSFIAVIASCVRVSSLVLWIRSSDISWNYPLLPLLCMIQSCVALVTSSLPAIYPLLRKPTPEQISRRQSRMPDPEREEKAWNSLEGSTLNNSRGDRRSRWSFMLWNGHHHGPKAAQAGVRDVPEEEKEVGEVEVEEVGPGTEHKMTAYVSSSDEARGINERMNSHRRMSADEESLTVPRIYMGGLGDGDSATMGEDYLEVGHAR